MLLSIDNLKMDDIRSLKIDMDSLSLLKNELEDFIKTDSSICSIDFSKKIMRSMEIKSNNTIEGYSDDLSSIESVIRDNSVLCDSEKRMRIINLYKGYSYILKRGEINKESLKELYYILSSGLLSSYDLSLMGDYYRLDDVFIYYSNNMLTPPDKGVSFDILEERMDRLINYLNDNSDVNSMTDCFIKSLIAHFYFVYLHPYFDINGRTSRTVSMWHLLNNGAFPYTIFNRAINNDKIKYYKEIRHVKQTLNVTSFVKLLMENTKVELEKEYVIDAINNSVNGGISSLEVSTILNILSMNGEKTLKDFAYLYNLKNDKRRVSDINFLLVSPLMDKGIIKKVRDTKSMYDGKHYNFSFSLDTDKLDLDPDRVRRLSL